MSSFYGNASILSNNNNSNNTTSENIVFINGDLPNTGTEEILYITKDGIYIWSNNDQAYINLTNTSFSLVWKELNDNTIRL